MAENDARELQFVNPHARPKKVTLQVSAASVSPIMSWYGAFYAGDKYKVFFDGKGVQMDRDGEMIAPRSILNAEKPNG